LRSMVYRKLFRRMASLRKGIVGLMRTVPVRYSGMHLGDLKVVERSDWRNRDREPTPLDWELANVALSAQAIYEIVERFPKRPDGEDRTEPWILTVCRAVCDAAEIGHSKDLEEDVLRQYVDRYGMGQIVEMYGINQRGLAERLERFRLDGG